MDAADVPSEVASGKAAGVSPREAVAHAMALLAGNPAAAETQAREILRVLPDDARAVFILGAARRRQGDALGARPHLQRVVDAHPGSALAHQELGLALAGLGESGKAVALLQRARDLRRDAPEAWRLLADQLVVAGDADGAALARAEHALAAGPPPAALAALRAGRLAEAMEVLRAHLLRSPGDLPARVVLAQTAARLGQVEQATHMLAACVAAAPGDAEARFAYAQVLHAQHRAYEALAQLDLLEPAAAQGLPARYLRLACHILCGAYTEAEALAASLRAEFPGEAAFCITHGQTLRIASDAAAAEAAFRAALALRPQAGEAWWCLADLKTTRFTDGEIAAMRAAAGNPELTENDRVQAGYALGKALEDRGEYEDSFRAYAAAARLRRSRLRYDPDHASAAAGLTQALFTPAFLAARPRGSLDDSPIFIVGMPRAGSTLVEQILVSHPDVEPTMELPYMARIAIDLARGADAGGPDAYQAIAALDQDALRRLAERYLAEAARHRRRFTRHFVDKLPGNYLHIGLIELLLPRARIIDVRRAPMAGCFAMFKQLFSGGQEFTYDLTELGRAWRDYVGLLDHFEQVMPGRVLRVQYEALVADTETQVRRLLAHCGLPFHAGCLRFWETARPITTHSSEQVRRPIDPAAVGRWRAFAPYLTELATALAPGRAGDAPPPG